jgi:23S rRNA pseudouridine1911/1915/1917 synthase
MHPSAIVVRLRNSVRLDRYLTGRLPHVSRNRIQRHIEQGDVLVDGRRVRASHRLHGGETLTLPPFEERKRDVASQPVELCILYEDRDLVVVDKQAGLLVHPSGEEYQRTLLNGLHCELAARGENAGGLGIVHRLDRWTSGLIVVAKCLRARRDLSRQVEARRVRRRYLGIVHGQPSADRGCVELSIRRDPRRPTRMQALDAQGVADVERSGWSWHVSASGYSDPRRDLRPRHARTHYRLLRRLRGASILCFELETGRTHQIRVHMEGLGTPLVGDPIYGAVDDRLGLSRPALHASALEFTHPSTGERPHFRAPLPADLLALIAKLDHRR